MAVVVASGGALIASLLPMVDAAPVAASERDAPEELRMDHELPSSPPGAAWTPGPVPAVKSVEGPGGGATVEDLRAGGAWAAGDPRVSTAAAKRAAPPLVKRSPILPGGGGVTFTADSRRSVDGAGKGTLEVFAEPTFGERDGKWTRFSGALEERPDADTVARASGMFVPVELGTDETSIVRFELDGSAVGLSSPDLDLGVATVEEDVVTYPGVAEGTDLRYVTSGATVKEDLILHSPSSPTSFRFHLSDPGRKLGDPIKRFDGGWAFTGATGSEQGVVLTAPYAYEQHREGDTAPFGEVSASMEVLRAGDGFDVVVQVDPAWLEGKQFPIVLDPTIKFTRKPNEAGSVDDALREWTRTSCGVGCGTWYDGLYGAQALGMGSWQYGNRARSYFFFDHKSAAAYLPDRATITSATYQMFYESCLGYPTGSNPYSDLCYATGDDYTVQVRRMLQSWTDADSLETLHTKASTTSSASTLVTARNNMFAWDIKGLVQGWVNFGTGHLPNHGFEMRTTTDHLPDKGGPTFNSSSFTCCPRQDPDDSGTTLTRPLLVINYTETAPAAVQNVTAVAVTPPAGSNTTAATVDWSAPTSGGEPSSYVVQAYNTDTGAHMAGFDRTVNVPKPCGNHLTRCSWNPPAQTITGLPTGKTYTFLVWAVNAVGAPNVAATPVTLWAAPQLAMLPPATGSTSSVGDQATWTLRVTNPNDRPYGGLGAIAVPVGTVPIPGTSKIDSTVCTPTPVLTGLPDNRCWYDINPAAPAVWFGIPPVAANGGARNLKFDLITTTGALTACDQRSMAVWVPTYSTPGVSTTQTFNASSNAPRTCASGLGLEKWWSFTERALGPNATAAANAANGNLVVQHLDSTPVQGHGQLGYVLRRTYNSQAPAAVPLSGASLGQGWSLNVAAAGDLATAGVTGDGLIVPVDLATGAAISLGNYLPGVVTMIDRDGTRHAFTPRTTTVASPLVTAQLDLTNPQAILASLGTLDLDLGSLASNITNVQGLGNLVNLCISTTYQSPRGVHLNLWRYVAVQSTATSGAAACTPQTGTSPIEVGYATMRPDRVTQVFDLTGRVTAMFDRAGNELRYTYGANGLAAVWEPGSCPGASGLPLAPVIPAQCRALRFDYSGGDVTVTDPAGRVVRYDRTGIVPNDRLAAVTTTDRDPADTNAVQLERWQYLYKGDAGTTGCTGPTGVLCSVIAPRFVANGGPATTFGYTTTGTPMVTSITEPVGGSATTAIGYFNVGQASAYTDTIRDGRAVRFTLDTAGRASAKQEGTLTGLGGTMTALRVANFVWDTDSTTCRPRDNKPDHNLCSVTRATGPTPGEFGAPTGWAASPDQATTYTYTPLGQILKQSDTLGAGNVVTTNGYQTSYRLPDGSTVNHTDTPAGNGNTTASPTGGPPDALYATSDLVETLPPRGNLSGASTTALRTTFTVDANSAVRPGTLGSSCGTGNTGLVCAENRPEGLTTSYTFDQFGQRASMRAPEANAGFTDGATCATVPSGVQPCSTVYQYVTSGGTDLSGQTVADGWLRAVTDPYGAFVAYGHDRAGNVIRAWDRDATARNALSLAAYPGTLANPPPDHEQSLYQIGTTAAAAARPWRYLRTNTDQLGNTGTWTVDAHGNALTTRPPRGNQAATAAFDTTQGFDANDRLTSVELPENDGQPSVVAYDGSGNVITTTDPNGHITTDRFDAVNRPIEHRWTRGAFDAQTSPADCVSSGTDPDRGAIPTGMALCRSAVTYDGHDHVTRATDGAGGITYSTYDQVGRRVSDFTYRNDNNPQTAANETWLQGTWLYDVADNATSACPARQVLEEGPCTATAHYGAHTTYDNADRPTKITTYREALDANGNKTGGWETLEVTTAYSPATSTVTVTDARGSHTTSSADLNGRTDRALTDRTDTTRVDTASTFSPSGDLLATDIRLEGATTPLNRTVHRYDAAHRLVDSVDAATSASAASDSNTYLAVGGSDPANVRTRSLYDPDGNIVGTYGPRAFTASVTNPDERFLTRVDLDGNGRPTAQWAPYYDDQDAAPVDVSFEDNECPATGGPHTPAPVTGIPAYPATVGVCVTRATYDPAGNLTRTTSPVAVSGATGQYQTYTWTDDNLLDAVETPNPAAGQAGQPDRITSTARRYDAVGRPTRVTDATGWSQGTTYTDDGLAIVTQAPAGVAIEDATEHSRTWFNAAAQPIETVSYADTATQDRRDLTTSTSYLATGSAHETSSTVTGASAAALTTRFAYDGAGNASRVWSPSAVASLTALAQAPAGTPSPTNPTGTPTVNTFTRDGLLDTTIEPVDTAIDLRRARQLTYDAAGRKLGTHTLEITGTNLSAVVRDAGTQQTTWSGNGWPLIETGRNGDGQITRTYTADGLLASVTDADSETATTNSYLLNSWLRTTATDSDAPNSPDASTVEFKYHADGARAAQQLDTTGTADDQITEYTYNDARALTGVDADGWGRSGDTWALNYDPVGRPATMVDPNGRVTTYERQPDPQVPTNGNLLTKTLYDGNDPGSDPELETWTHQYDGLNRVTNRTRTSGDLPAAITDTFDYDEAGRLDTFTGQTVRYDPNGNRTQVGPTDTWTYRADNSIRATGGVTFAYTPSGSVSTNNCLNSDYDGLDRLGSSTINAATCGDLGNVTTYRYDGLDRQTQASTETSGSVLDERIDFSYVGLDQSLYTETSTEADGTARYTSANDQALAVTGTNDWHVLSSDGQGNTTTALSATDIECSVDLSAWGTPRNAAGADNPCITGATPNNRWFNGGRRDDNTQNYQWGNRTYDPDNASWLQPDNTRGPGAPTDLSIGTDPLLANRYSYVNGDPINLADPTGHSADSEERWAMNTGQRQGMPGAPRPQMITIDTGGESHTITQRQAAEINADHGGSANCALSTRGQVTVYSEEHDACGIWKTTHSRSIRQRVANFAGGVLESVSFNQSRRILSALELDAKVDFTSAEFTAGEIVATIVDAKSAIQSLTRAGLRTIASRGAARIGSEAAGLADEGIDLVTVVAHNADEGGDVARAVTNSIDEVATSQIARNKVIGDDAADAIASRYPDARREFTIQADSGARRLDVLTPDGLAIESKVGRTSLTRATRQQVARDGELLQNPLSLVREVEWHFGVSPITGRVGPTAPLLGALKDAGIRVVM